MINVSLFVERVFKRLRSGVFGKAKNLATDAHRCTQMFGIDQRAELVLAAAANGRAVGTVTFNRRDFGTAPLQFGVEVLTPIEAVRRIKK